MKSILLRSENPFGKTSKNLIFSASIISIPAGKRSDKIGRKRLLVTGYIIFAIVYLGFAFTVNKLFLIAIFILYGLYTAMTAGVERALFQKFRLRN